MALEPVRPLHPHLQHLQRPRVQPSFRPQGVLALPTLLLVLLLLTLLLVLFRRRHRRLHRLQRHRLQRLVYI